MGACSGTLARVDGRAGLCGRLLVLDGDVERALAVERFAHSLAHGSLVALGR